MSTRLHFLLGIVILVGCGPDQIPEASDEGEGTPHFQVGVGGQEDFDAPDLLFAITAVHERQKPSDEAPFFEDGGEWTYFDCQAKENTDVMFSLGFVARALDHGGLVFENDEARTLDEAMTALEVGISAYVEEHGIDLG